MPGVDTLRPLEVFPQPGYTTTLANVGSVSVYYKADSSLSAANKDGILTAGATLKITGQTWLLAAAAGAQIDIRQAVPAPALAGVAAGGPEIPQSLGLTGSGERARSIAAHRAAYDEAVWVETWANLTEWVLEEAANVQVSEGKLFGKNKTNALAARPFAPGETGRFRIACTVFVKPGGTTNKFYGVGVTTQEAGAPEFAAPATFYEFACDSGQTRAFAGGAGANQEGVLTEGLYNLTITGDESFVSWTMVKSDRSLETRYRRSRALIGSIKRAVVINQDPRELTGGYIAPLGARLSQATIAPRAGIETTGISRTVWTQDKNGQNIRLEFPAVFDSRIPPLGWIFYCHSAESSETEPMTHTTMTAMFKTLVEAGFCIASSNMHENSFGNEQSQTDLLALYEYVRDHYPLAPIVLMGASMGCLAASVALRRQKIPGIAGAVFLSGLVNLGWAYEHRNEETGQSPYNAILREAYGIDAQWTNYSEKTAGLDPMLFEPVAFRGIPIGIAASNSDQIVTSSANGLQLATRLEGYCRNPLEAGSNPHVIVTTGTHMAEGNFPGAPVKEFCEACLLT